MPTLQRDTSEVEELQKVLSSPLEWSRHFLHNPKNGDPLQDTVVLQRVLSSKRRWNVLRLHRRSGKTLSLIILALYYALNMEYCRVLYVAPRMSQVTAFWEAMESFIDSHPFIEECITGGTQKPYKKEFSNHSIIKGFTSGSASNNKGDGLRGQEADLVLLDEASLFEEEDFMSLQPIMEGDEFREFPPIVFAASTPRGAFGRYHKWCTEGEHWNRIKISIEENPIYTKKRIKQIRSRCTEREWLQEFMVEFLETGFSVFAPSLIEIAMHGPLYTITQKPVSMPEVPNGKPVKRVWRTMGVDWDKYNEDGSGPNIVVIEVDERIDRGKDKNGNQLPRGDGKPRLIYRESIPQGAQCLNEAVERIKILNDQMNPDAIYIDPGQGENQIEVLKMYGKQHPHTRLDKKVRRLHFGSNVIVRDPIDLQQVKKPAKEYMVNLLGKWLENFFFEFSPKDKKFKEQLTNYRIKSRSSTHIKYFDNNDHIIAAAGLAALAMDQIHTSEFRIKQAYTSYMMPSPERMAASDVSSAIIADISRKSPVAGALLGAPAKINVGLNSRLTNKPQEESPELPDPPDQRRVYTRPDQSAFQRQYIDAVHRSLSSKTTRAPARRKTF